MMVLSPAQAYRRWAPRYAEETAVSFLEESAVRALPLPPLAGRLLDVGCGTARRLAASGAALGVGIDLTVDMLRHAVLRGTLAAADMRALPFADSSFDRVWCRLMIGHVRELRAAYRELTRVCRVGGHVIVTDFHSEAALAGHRRTFRDDAGVVCEVEHHVHDPTRHFAAAVRAGLELIGRRDDVVGPLIRHFYEDAGCLAAYDEQLGLPLVLTLAYRRAP